MVNMFFIGYTKSMETIEIELSMEEWGHVAMIAHRLDLTINATIEHMLQQFIDAEKNQSAEPE